jgi:hypothetical protein
MGRSSRVAVLRTRPETVIEDYGRLLRLVKYDQVLPRDQDLILKLNLSWTRYFPACSTQPWQLDGVLTTLLADGYDRRRLLPVENRTVVTDPVKGCRNNRWDGVLRRHGLPFIPLTEVEWTVYHFRSPLLRLNELFPDGIEVPALYVGRNVLHLPTVKCVHPDTEILLADGRLVRAEALVKEWHVRGPVRELPDGDRVSEGEVPVVSLSGSGLGGASATHFWRTPASDPTAWTVTTRTGRTVTTSALHLFLTPEGWTPACRLRAGDRVAIARRVRIPGASQPLPAVGALGPDQRARAPERTSPDFWRWMGYFTAGGRACAVRGSYRISFTSTDPDVRRDYVALSRSLFGVEPRRRGSAISFDAAPRRPFFEALGSVEPTGAASREVPPLLFACPDDEIAAFLQGYLDGSGTVDPRTGVRAVTESRRLASQIQALLARLGVVAVVRTVRPRAADGRRPAKAPQAAIAVGGDDVVALASHVRLRCGRKQRALQGLLARRRAGRRPGCSA